MKKWFSTRFLFSLVSGLFLSFYSHAQWNHLPQDTNNINCAVYFINQDTGFISGDYAYLHTLIQRTTDGGQTWDSTIIINGLMAMSICFPNDTIGYCGGQSGRVYKTINMGQSWFNVSIVGSLQDFGAMYFINKDTGFVSDFNGKIYRTINGALSWTVVSTYQNSFENFYPGTGKFQFINDSVGFVANGNYGKVMKTNNFGATWSSINLPSGNTWAMSVYMFDKDTGIVVAENGKVWKTNTGGNSWIGPQIISAYDLMDIAFFNDSVGYIVGGENSNYIFHSPTYPPVGAKIFVTSDRGLTWTVDTSLCCDWFTSICNAGNNVGYAVGWHGWAYKINDALSLSSVVANEQNVKFKIFPNPTSEVLTIDADEKIIRIELIDVVGNTILSRENSNDIDVHLVPNGLYFLRIETAGGSCSEKIVIQH